MCAIKRLLGTAQQLDLNVATLMREVCAQGLAHHPISVRFPLEQPNTEKPLQKA